MFISERLIVFARLLQALRIRTLLEKGFKIVQKRAASSSGICAKKKAFTKISEKRLANCMQKFENLCINFYLVVRIIKRNKMHSTQVHVMKKIRINPRFHRSNRRNVKDHAQVLKGPFVFCLLGTFFLPC